MAVIAEQDFRSLEPGERRALRADDFRGLARAAVWFFLVLAGVLLFTFGQTYLQAYVGQMIMKDLRTEAFDHTVGLSLRYLDSQPVGRLVNRITNDVETINELFTSVLPSLLRDFVMMGGVLVALTLLSPRLALVTLATLPPVLVLTLLFRSRAREVFRRVRQAVSRLNGFLAEHLSGMRIVQLFVRERFSLGQFRERNDRLLEANLGEMYVFATFRPLVDLFSTTSLAVIVYFGGRFVLRDLVSLGTLIAFLNLIRMFYEPVMDLSEKYNILQSAMAGSERVFGLLDTDARIPEPAAPKALDGGARGHRVRPGQLRLQGGGSRCCGSSRFRVRAGRDRGHRGLHRRRQDHHHLPAHPAVGHPIRVHPPGRDGHPRVLHRQPAPARAVRSARRVPVLRDDRGKHPPGQPHSR